MIKRYFKKLIILSLIAVTSVSVVGCSKNKDSEEKDSSDVINESSNISDTGDKTESSNGEGIYWSEKYTFPTENGEIHPYLIYRERKIDVPFTPEEFFEGATNIICGKRNADWVREDVDQVADIANFQDGDLDWFVRVDDYLPVSADDDYTELQFANLHDKEASPGQVYRDMAYKVSVGTWKIFDADGYDHDYSTQIDMHDNADIERVYFDNFGIPTMCVDVMEMQSYSDEYPTYWIGGDVVYYSANYPDDIIYENINKNGWTVLWDNGPIEIEWDDAASPADASSSGDDKEIKKYYGDDLENLNLTGTLSVDSIDIVYNDVSCTVEPGFSVDEMLGIFGEPSNDVDWHNKYTYGTSANDLLSHKCPVEFEYVEGENGELKLGAIGVSLETAATVSIMGIDEYTTAEELAAILGTPSSIGKFYNGFHKEQSIYWDNLSIGGFEIEYVKAYYFDEVLAEITVKFK